MQARLRAVVLESSEDHLPTLAVPAVRVSTIGTRPIAMPDVALVGRAAFESGEAALRRARLAVYRAICATRARIESCHDAPSWSGGSGKRRRAQVEQGLDEARTRRRSREI
jgi:hypothetical protein